MKHSRFLLFLALTIAVSPSYRALSEVVRPAPEVVLSAPEGKTRKLSSLRGQPVILLLADSPSRGAYKSQLKELENSFDRLAVRGTIIAAGFKKGTQGTSKTNVPLVHITDGASTSAALGIKENFAIVLLGPDGNVDYQTGKVLNINRILEVMQNSYEIQKSARRGAGDNQP